MGERSSFVHFLENVTSCACFERSGLKDVFYVYAQSLTLSRQLVSCDAEWFLFWTTEEWSVICKKLYKDIPSEKIIYENKENQWS